MLCSSLSNPHSDHLPFHLCERLWALVPKKPQKSIIHICIDSYMHTEQFCITFPKRGYNPYHNDSLNHLSPSNLQKGSSTASAKTDFPTQCYVDYIVQFVKRQPSLNIALYSTSSHYKASKFELHSRLSSTIVAQPPTMVMLHSTIHQYITLFVYNNQNYILSYFTYFLLQCHKGYTRS